MLSGFPGLPVMPVIPAIPGLPALPQLSLAFFAPMAAGLSAGMIIKWGTGAWVPRVVSRYGFDYFEWRRPWSPGFTMRISTNCVLLSLLAALGRGLPTTTWPFLALMILACFGVVQSDARLQIIPDRFQVAGFVGALGFILTKSMTKAGAYDWLVLGQQVGMGLIAALVLSGMNLLYERVRKRSALGWGDVKLVTWLAIVFGSDILGVLILATFVSLLFLLPLLLIRRRGLTSTFAFGPYIVIGAVLFLAQAALIPV